MKLSSQDHRVLAERFRREARKTAAAEEARRLEIIAMRLDGLADKAERTGSTPLTAW